MGIALDYETDPNEESDSASSSDSNYELWDPVTDTYKDKRTNESVSDDIKLGKGVTGLVQIENLIQCHILIKNLENIGIL